MRLPSAFRSGWTLGVLLGRGRRILVGGFSGGAVVDVAANGVSRFSSVFAKVMPIEAKPYQ